MPRRRQRLKWYAHDRGRSRSDIARLYARPWDIATRRLAVCCLQAATRSLAPLEATAGYEKAQQIRSTLNALGAKKVSVNGMGMLPGAGCCRGGMIGRGWHARCQSTTWRESPRGLVCMPPSAPPWPNALATQAPNANADTTCSLPCCQAPVLDKIKQTPQSPRTDVPPLDKPMAAAPPLRGSARRAGDEQTGSGAGSPPAPAGQGGRATGDGASSRAPTKQELGETLPYVK